MLFLNAFGVFLNTLMFQVQDYNQPINISATKFFVKPYLWA
jgi:hypothetical protein